MRRLLFFGAMAVVTAGCAASAPATAGQLRSRAAFELACPPEALTLVRIDETTGGVFGCGRRVVYVERCEGRACSWAFDREVPVPPMRSYAHVHTLPRAPGLAQDSEWRRRIPGLVDDQPGF
ncbi:MAG: hypothetical protein KC776_11420 [Myxococcales bacterium]|nr:hypothetical protein [Myxococcales bacterium]MCB9579230.1 hypothetical protein [Polyangiaceae bacterium]